MGSCALFSLKHKAAGGNGQETTLTMLLSCHLLSKSLSHMQTNESRSYRVSSDRSSKAVFKIGSAGFT